VLEKVSITKDRTMVQKSLIKWKDSSIENVTWEDDDVIPSQFPEFSLEDKLILLQVVLLAIVKWNRPASD